MGGWHNINKFDEPKKTRTVIDENIIKLLFYNWPDSIIANYLNVTNKRVKKIKLKYNIKNYIFDEQNE